ncbi:MAG: hypothetical protein DSY43_04835 [Gammaproteobacteria bacterium]|nr:MAG: hypothetical protein DSY43_04835 [Gammaproteobacteria bacterium]
MLKKLQQQFYQDVLIPNGAKNYLNEGNFNGSHLMQIYHNQYFLSLTEALGKTYSCVKRLVGEDFFNQIAKEFILVNPSKTGNIIDYGDNFADFIQSSPQCKTVPYLADVAKFERCYDRCYFLGIVFFMHSVYPITKIWQLNENSEQLDLNSGEEYLKIYRQDGEVLVEKLTQQQYKEK